MARRPTRALTSSVRRSKPFAIEVNGDGTKGYYSVLYVKSDSTYKDIKDLKGKNLCLVGSEFDVRQQRPAFRDGQDGYRCKVLLQGSLFGKP